MRYLFGDSSPFPLHYNFLATLESFIIAAAKAAELEAQYRAAFAVASEAAQSRTKAVEGLERFHQVVMHALRDSSSRSLEALTLEYARQLAEQAARIVDNARATADATNDRELAGTRTEGERRRIEVRTALEGFFRNGKLPTIEARVTCTLEGSRDGKSAFTAVLSHPDNIVAAYTLSTDRVPEWSHARRVGEFVQSMSMNVGARRSWFKKTVEPEPVPVHEYFIGGFELSDDHAELRLRRRPEVQDSLIFILRRIDTNLLAEVHHPGDPDAQGQLPTSVDPHDRAQLERLWLLLRAGVAPLFEHKDRVTALSLDAEDVFETGKVLALIDRIVHLMGPTVTEIARRSPNPQELSLKTESDDGRREELYVKKMDLLRKLTPLSPQERRIFAPLGFVPEAFLGGANLSEE
jgi:hypothetical protein